MSEGPKPCFARCQFFRCGQKTLYFKAEVAMCRFADDECNIKSCNYANCVKGKLLPNGVCELTVKAKPIDIRPEEVAEPFKVPSKLVQKIKERELY